MFKFIVDGKVITDNRIHWKFAGTNLEFKSDEAKLERNILFWRNKYKVGADVEIEYLNVKKVEDHVKPDSTEPLVESHDQSDSSVVDAQPVVSQDTADNHNSNKRKRKPKTTNL